MSLRAAARSIFVNGAWHPLPDEGVWLTVGGAVSHERVGEWRAGRTLLAPVVFRRPARYLNEGVPDAERDLALDGTALLGSVKSGLLVQVEQRRHWRSRKPPRALVRTSGARGAMGDLARSASRERSSSRSSSETARGFPTTSVRGCRLPAPTTSSRSRAATSRFSPGWCCSRLMLLGVQGRPAALSRSSS